MSKFFFSLLLYLSFATLLFASERDCCPLSLNEKGVEGTLSLQVECHFKCLGSEENIEERLNIFAGAETLGLQRGNGNLWALLTMSLKFYSEEACLKEAKEICQDLRAIESFAVPTIRSGQWQMNTDLKCSREQEDILSPFDKAVEVDYAKVFFPPFRHGYDSHFPWHQAFRTYWRSAINLEEDTCEKLIPITWCFGDCMRNEGGNLREYLASSIPLRTDSLKICADDLYSSYSPEDYSEDVFRHIKSTYVLWQLKEMSVTGLTCSSARFTSP